MTFQDVLGHFGISQLTAVGGIAITMAGVLLLLCGYRLVWLAMFLSGAVIGFALSSLVVDSPLALLIGAVFGLIGVVLADLGVFVLGMGVGGLATVLAGVSEPLVLIGVGLVGGIVALAIRKFVIIVATSFAGAYLLVGAGMAACKSTNATIALFGPLVLALVGVVWQYACERSSRRTSRTGSDGTAESKGKLS